MAGLMAKTAVVTGSSRGIGKAIALELAAQGCDVVVSARSERPGELPGTIDETREAVEALGRRALAVRTDVTIDDDLRALVEQALTLSGRIDILINNAGGAGGAWDYLTGDVERLDYNYRLNLRSPFVLTQLVAAQMIVAGGGAVINISSGAARNLPPPRPGVMPEFNVTYGVTKAGLDRWATGVAQVLLDKNIAIINVNPGFTITERVLAAPGGATRQGESPETTAKVVAFLCQDPMTYTGQIVTSRAFFDEHKLA